MKRIGTICVLLSILGVIGPITSCLLANTIASYLGVNLTARGPETINIDIGNILWNMSMMPWFLVFTAPACFILFLVGLLLRNFNEN